MIGYMSPLLKYRENIYSQNGEDGVLGEILRRLGISKGWFCEFGAWDGKHLSNTYALIDCGWKGVAIEGDTARFAELQRTSAALPTGALLPINCYVSDQEHSRLLDTLLATTPIPQEFDVLSIDIDSTDYQVWASLRHYRPKIVIIEIDSSVPPPGHKIASHDNPGTSFASMVLLARKKGYTAACHTGNVIFVRDDFFPSLGLPSWVAAHPEKMFIYSWVRKRSLGILAKKAHHRFQKIWYAFFRSR